VMLGALPDGRASEAVIGVLAELAGRLPEQLRRSLAWDCGSEMSGHADFRMQTGCPVYFCDPHSPWQRGSNENTNGLLRQYFPKGSTDFRRIGQDHLDTVAAELNGRPRETLGWRTPAEALNTLLGAAAKPRPAACTCAARPAGQAPACPRLCPEGAQRLQGQGRPQAVARSAMRSTLEAGGAGP